MNHFSKVWVQVAIGAFFFWLSLPPLRQPWAAFVACAIWTSIVSRAEPLQRRDYWMTWFVGCGLWLVLLQGVRLANPMLYPGWIALGFYLGVYLPLFLGLARSLRMTLGVPLSLSVGIAWVSCECIRAYFATGFSACMLGHSQTPWPSMLAIAAHFGGYGVSFLVMIIGALLFLWAEFIVSAVFKKQYSRKPNSVERILLSVFVALVIGWSIMSFHSFRDQQANAKSEPIGRFLIVQEDMPTMWDIGRDELQLGWERYELQTEMFARTPNRSEVDVVLWPESTFSGGVPFVAWDHKPFARSEWEMTAADFELTFSKLVESFENKRSRLANALTPDRPYFLMGSDIWKIQEGELAVSNGAIWFNSVTNAPVQKYAKQHLVMFGEYIPLLCWFPKWNSALGLPSVDAGTEATSFQMESGNCISTTICFEDVVPHLVRSNLIRQLARGESPDVLVNLTNDAWFRGSSILDHHLNNAILAAVENRRPMLVAANQGISAWIDSQGQIVKSLPRLESGSILAVPLADGRWGLWQAIGDWPAWLLVLVSFSPAVIWQLVRWSKSVSRLRARSVI